MGKSSPEREKLLWRERKLTRWQLERKRKHQELARGKVLSGPPKALARAQPKTPARGAGSEIVAIPHRFSFLDNPEETLRKTNHIRATLKRRSVRSVYIDHSSCAVLDLGASAVMDIAVMDARGERSKADRLQTSGRGSAVNRHVNILLQSIGIVHRLGVDLGLSPDLASHIETLELFSGHPKRQARSCTRDQAGTSLTEYFDHCLRRTGHELSVAGKDLFTKLITEVVGNAEEHSGGRWFAMGFWADTTDGAGECQIVIFNYGRTIFESLSSDRTPAETRILLSQLSDHHERQGLFGPDWDRETLWTLYSLQEGVSRFAIDDDGTARGRGTVQMIQAFESLAPAEQRRMCILSGNSYILFDGRYDLSKDKGIRRIAFNSDNDFRRPPDSGCVRSLRDRFPGTLVGLRLSLDQAFIAKLLGDGNEEN